MNVIHLEVLRSQYIINQTLPAPFTASSVETPVLKLGIELKILVVEGLGGAFEFFCNCMCEIVALCIGHVIMLHEDLRYAFCPYKTTSTFTLGSHLAKGVLAKNNQRQPSKWRRDFTVL